MRKKRANKNHRKYRKITACLQIVLVWCFLLIAGTNFSTYTNASFNDVEEVAGTVKADWKQEEDEYSGDPPTPDQSWDKSSLKVLNDNGFGFVCENGEVELFSYIKNGKDSEGMAGTSKFEVFFAENGNPKMGVKMYTGEIKALKSGESTKLVFAADIDTLQVGNYKFKSYQRPDHPGKGELWNETFYISQQEIDACIAANVPESVQDEESTDIELSNNVTEELVEEDTDTSEDIKTQKRDEVEGEPVAKEGQGIDIDEITQEQEKEETIKNPGSDN